MIRFTVHGDQQPKGRARSVIRNGKIGHYTPKKTMMYEDMVREEVKRMMFGGVYDGPVEVKIKIFIRIPVAFTKKKRDDARNGFLRPTSRPDIDNYIKAICDAMNKIVYNDDSQIVDIDVKKYYSDLPRA